MTIQVGDNLPEGTLQLANDGPQPVNASELFAGKKVVLFAVPGAFTPTCSAKHLPGYVDHYQALKDKGVDTVACLSVNDAFVMGAWGKSQSVPEGITLLADGNGTFAMWLPCSELDGAACVAGRVKVRADDRVHFEPSADPTGTSPGSRRWAEAAMALLTDWVSA